MEQIVKLISERTGLPEDQARQAALLTINFIKEKLPPNIAAQIDLLIGGQAAGDAAQQAMGALGGLFGKKD